MIRVLACTASTAAFETCFDIRLTVFVGEQNVPLEEERDEWDERAQHFLALWRDEPVGTARALQKSLELIRISRVAVLEPYRKLGVGAALLQAVEDSYPGAAFVLDAQLQALRFYERLGYVAEGPVFQDAGIPHKLMRK